MRRKVLVVSHGDWLEVFAEEDVDVRIVHMPRLPDTESDEFQITAETYLEGTLPENYKRLFFQGNLRVADVTRCPSPRELADRSWGLDMIQSADKAKELLDTPF